jgi:hypothetical protein
MADNVDITPGTGATVAADLIGGALYQRIKIALGADGSATDLGLGQQLKTASLPVVLASDTDPLVVSGPSSTFTDRSGSVTTGGTSQQLAAANSTRKYLLLINLSDTIMWVNFGTAAVADQPSIPLGPANAIYDGGILEYNAGVVPSGSVNLLCATTGKKFVCKEV